MLVTTDTVFCTSGLRIPHNELHQILPLGANATVHCLPEPNISLPILSWTIDNSLSYDLHMAFYNSKGIKVHLTVDNNLIRVGRGKAGKYRSRRKNVFYAAQLIQTVAILLLVILLW